MVLEFAGEFFDDRGFTGAAHGEVADGDHLHAEGGVPQDTGVIEELASLDREEKGLGKTEEDAAEHGGAFAGSLLEDDFENESLEFFDPGLETVTHSGRVCQPPYPRASGRLG